MGQVIAFHAMLSDAGETVAGMQFHPDAESMEFHLEAVAELLANAGDVLEIEIFTVLGRSSEMIDGLMRNPESRWSICLTT